MPKYVRGTTTGPAPPPPAATEIKIQEVNTLRVNQNSESVARVVLGDAPGQAFLEIVTSTGEVIR